MPIDPDKIPVARLPEDCLPAVVEKLVEPLRETKIDLQKQTVTLTWRGLISLLGMAILVGGVYWRITAKQDYRAKLEANDAANEQSQINDLKVGQKSVGDRVDAIYQTLMNWERK
jgi:hypothetical protein